jgi:THO complex subunit 2
MIPFLVEATRYLTDFELDVLLYSLIESFGRESKERIEKNGFTIEKWLKSLASFCAALFRKHNIDLEGILQYIANKILTNQVYDLIILQELISTMTGITLPEDATTLQLDSLSGGYIIRREGLSYESVRATKKSTMRLVKAVLNTKLALPLGLLICQQRKEIVYRYGQDNQDSISELKILAWLNDHV